MYAILSMESCIISICETITTVLKDSKRVLRKPGIMERFCLSQAVKPSSINNCLHTVLE